MSSYVKFDNCPYPRVFWVPGFSMVVSGVEMPKRTGFAHFGWWFQRLLFLPYLGKWCDLTNSFQMSWNHQLETGFPNEAMKNLHLLIGGRLIASWRVGHRFLPMNDGQRQNFGKKNTWNFPILSMVQKSQTTTWDVKKKIVNSGINYHVNWCMSFSINSRMIIQLGSGDIVTVACPEEFVRSSGDTRFKCGHGLHGRGQWWLGPFLGGKEEENYQGQGVVF